MVRPAEQANTTNPAAERRFDSKVIYAFIGGAILLLLVFFFLVTRWVPYGKTVNTESNTSRTQEDDKRASP
ncbi:MAG TPA: hypothetical protein VIL74_11560 [Pyrinomonadaceae bacterium]